MSLMDTLQPSYRPDLSKAKRVSFQTREDIKEDELAKVEKEQKKEAYRQNVIYRMRLHRWKKKRELEVKKIKRLRNQLNAAIRNLEVIDHEKPLQVVSGIPVFVELESLYVEQKAEVSTSS